MNYEVIIIGAGPAGLFAAEKISSRKPNAKILVIDRGREIQERKCPARASGKACMQCKLCNISFGIGGAGGLSDGKLNLDHRIGMDIDELRIDKDKAKKEIKYIDNLFVKYGADGNLSGQTSEDIQKWVKKSKDLGATLIPVRQRHMGSDKTPEIIGNFKKELMKRGVEFIVKTEVNEILSKKEYIVKTTKGDYRSRFLLAAPGRGGAYWFRNQAEKLGVEYTYGEIDVGIRVELNAEVYQPLTDLFYDPKFIIERSHLYNDKVRTFCTNPNGEVTAELVPIENSDEKSGNLILVNGHAKKDEKTKNTNFAILHTIRLTNPQGDTTNYGRNIAEFVNFISGQKPLVQRYGDFMQHRRSTEESINKGNVKPTLQGCNPGDLGMAFTYRTMTNIMDMISTLDKILPGVADNSTLLYGPEIKFYDTKYKTNKNLETKIENLYVAGDGAGKSRGIIGAALSGILAAEGIISKLK